MKMGMKYPAGRGRVVARISIQNWRTERVTPWGHRVGGAHPEIGEAMVTFMRRKKVKVP